MTKDLHDDPMRLIDFRGAFEPRVVITPEAVGLPDDSVTFSRDLTMSDSDLKKVTFHDLRPGERFAYSLAPVGEYGPPPAFIKLTTNTAKSQHGDGPVIEFWTTTQLAVEVIAVDR